jgi:hypothetical protein
MWLAYANGSKPVETQRSKPITAEEDIMTSTLHELFERGEKIKIWRLHDWRNRGMIEYDAVLIPHDKTGEPDAFVIFPKENFDPEKEGEFFRYEIMETRAVFTDREAAEMTLESLIDRLRHQFVAEIEQLEEDLKNKRDEMLNTLRPFLNYRTPGLKGNS